MYKKNQSKLQLKVRLHHNAPKKKKYLHKKGQ